jgi:hypothetical protein
MDKPSYVTCERCVFGCYENRHTQDTAYCLCRCKGAPQLAIWLDVANPSTDAGHKHIVLRDCKCYYCKRWAYHVDKLRLLSKSELDQQLCDPEAEQRLECWRDRGQGAG